MRARAQICRIVLAVGALVALPQITNAQPSHGCSAVNNTFTDASGYQILADTFNAGETVAFSISGGLATESQIVVDGVIVESSNSNPSTIFYTFPTTKVYTTVTFSSLAAGEPASVATMTITCPAVPPTVPVPTLSGWGMVLLGLSLGGAGSWYLIGRPVG